MTLLDPTTRIEASPLQEYEARLFRGLLPYQRCAACTRAVFHPRVICPHCGALDLEWQESAGVGTVYSVTRVRSRQGSRTVMLVDLDEGYRMMGRGDEPNDVDSTRGIAIGDRVRADVPPGTTIASLRFAPGGVS